MILEKIKICINCGRYTVLLACGAIVYLSTGRTPGYAYQAMIALFCLTGGRSNDFLAKLVRVFSGQYVFSGAAGVLGDMASPAIREEVLDDLTKNGFHVFEQRLPDHICDALLKFATSEPCRMRAMDNQQVDKKPEPYHRGLPQAVRYDFTPAQLLANADLQSLLSDESFYQVAQDYLGSKPVMDVLGMWWHTAFQEQPDMEAAQFYHFDMDRPKWLKFFIYLTDVGPENGPHYYVAGSHKTRAIPRPLLRKGYARLTDDEVAAHYAPADFIEYTAPRGTIIAEDTRGLHKGKHVHQGDRLILQIQFSNCLFGGEYPKARFPTQILPGLADKIRRYPDIFKAYT